mgnify:FL=1
MNRAAFRRAGLAVAALLLASLAGPARAGFDLEAQRKAFETAWRDAEAGIAAPAGGDAAALVDYPLYPYVEAARLRAALAGRGSREPAQPLDVAVANFLARHGSEPVSRLVRRPWLLL